MRDALSIYWETASLLVLKLTPVNSYPLPLSLFLLYSVYVTIDAFITIAQ